MIRADRFYWTHIKETHDAKGRVIISLNSSAYEDDLNFDQPLESWFSLNPSAQFKSTNTTIQSIVRI